MREAQSEGAPYWSTSAQILLAGLVSIPGQAVPLPFSRQRLLLTLTQQPGHTHRPPPHPTGRRAAGDTQGGSLRPEAPPDHRRAPPVSDGSHTQLTKEMAMNPRRGLSILCAAAALVLFTTANAGAQLVPNFDHLKCYTIKDFAPKKTYKVDLLPEQKNRRLTSRRAASWSVPAKLFCIDVVKQNVQPLPPVPRLVRRRTTTSATSSSVRSRTCRRSSSPTSSGIAT